MTPDDSTVAQDAPQAGTTTVDYSNIPDDADIPEDVLKSMNEDDIMKLFVMKMIDDKGAENTDELRAKLTNELNEKINIAIISNLPDYLVDNLNKKDNITEEDLSGAVSEAGIDVATITQNAMIDFRNDYLKAEA